VLNYEGRVRVLIGLHEFGPTSARTLQEKGVGNLADIHYHSRKLFELGAAEATPSDSAAYRNYRLTDFGRDALRIAAMVGKR
jgi:hypothetical protein